MPRTFQIVKPFRKLSVLENVTLAAFLRLPKRRHAEGEAHRVLEEVGLGGKITPCLRPDGKRAEKAGDREGPCDAPETPAPRRADGSLNSTEIDTASRLVRQICASGITIIWSRPYPQGDHELLRSGRRHRPRGEDRGHAASGSRHEHGRNRARTWERRQVSMLVIKDLEVAYGKVQVLWGVTLTMRGR